MPIQSGGQRESNRTTEQDEISKSECVKRARRLNKLAVAAMKENRLHGALMARNDRDRFMALARSKS